MLPKIESNFIKFKQKIENQMQALQRKLNMQRQKLCESGRCSHSQTRTLRRHHGYGQYVEVLHCLACSYYCLWGKWSPENPHFDLGD